MLNDTVFPYGFGMTSNSARRRDADRGWMRARKAVVAEADVLRQRRILLQIVQPGDPAEARRVIVRCQPQLLRELLVLLVHVDDQHVVIDAADDVAVAGVVFFVKPMRLVVGGDRGQRRRTEVVLDLQVAAIDCRSPRCEPPT